MNFNLLRYFLAIVTAGSITHAAETLHLPQPYLSQQLKKLEAELGVTLMHRTTRQLTLTNAGVALEKRARQLLELQALMVTDVQNRAQGRQGTLRVGGVGAVISQILMPRLLQYHQQFPEINFEIRECWTNDIFDLLSNGMVELGVIRTPVASHLFNTITFSQTPLVALSSTPQQQLAQLGLNGLRQQRLLVDHHYADLIIQTCRQAGIEPQIVAKVDSSPMLIALAEAGLGVAIVPQDMTHNIQAHQLQLYSLDTPALMTQTAVIWPKQADLSETAQQFLKLLQTKKT
ncbi:LysR family transcriptional regulator [Loigolactobacillus bifermentans]|uniref:LysR family transcriptional regulator n=1 Tax=Loigolactobacillus bifermentans DSM 20003 TaxID=1423726 RepID=A0A0R1H6K9_9LACO|nr:LysR family transcriptional regulator [Loigolactobacillus bifermentans]KRK39098.1 LysR family transcriptional regulator [Loigolactobacillus bifermentans DSM 20003]QGG59014.1 LysR family transcriptional regulator [Loigolactobacillus bifermentans]